MGRGGTWLRPFLRELIYRSRQQSKMTTLWLPSLVRIAKRKPWGKLKSNSSQNKSFQCGFAVMPGTSVWWFLVYPPQSYKVYYSTEIRKTFRSAACGTISGGHWKRLQCICMYSECPAGGHPSSAEMPSLCGPSACFLLYFHNNASRLGPATDRKLGHPSMSVLPLRGDIAPPGRCS